MTALRQHIQKRILNTVCDVKYIEILSFISLHVFFFQVAKNPSTNFFSPPKKTVYPSLESFCCQMVATGHGPMLSEHLGSFVEYYKSWSQKLGRRKGGKSLDAPGMRKGGLLLVG